MPGGSTSITISVPTEQDVVVEGNEEFVGVLSLTGSVSGVVLGPQSTATATIQDDDGKIAHFEFYHLTMMVFQIFFCRSKHRVLTDSIHSC